MFYFLRCFKTLTHQLMMIIYLGTAHVVNLSNQNEVIILITSLSKPSSVSLCMRGKLYHSHFVRLQCPVKTSETHSRASSHWARERRGRGESMGKLMAFHAGMAIHAEKSCKWLAGPDGLEPDIRSVGAQWVVTIQSVLNDILTHLLQLGCWEDTRERPRKCTLIWSPFYC